MVYAAKNLKSIEFQNYYLELDYWQFSTKYIINMSESKDLSFAGNDPGAAKYGNFINYYSFHSPNERIHNLDARMFQSIENKESIVCLDIGCNTGDLTKELYIYLKAIFTKSKIKILAIDIDSTLIERAKEQNDNTNISFLSCDITINKEYDITKRFPNTHCQHKFDIIFCFSVTMWIHINNGDEDLLNFLKFIRENTKIIIIEPQPWKCYKNAQRRMKRSGKQFEMYNTLNMRDNIDNVIEEYISETHIKVYESPASSWNRKILSFLLK